MVLLWARRVELSQELFALLFRKDCEYMPAFQPSVQLLWGDNRLAFLDVCGPQAKRVPSHVRDTTRAVVPPFILTHTDRRIEAHRLPLLGLCFASFAFTVSHHFFSVVPFHL